MVTIPVSGGGIIISRGEDGVQTGSRAALGGGEDSSSVCQPTFLVLTALSGAWEVHSNRLEPKTGQIVY